MHTKKSIHPVLLILIFAIICVAATVIILISMGYRYVTNADGYSFIGKVVNGQPVNGTIKYPDGKTATLDYYNRTIEYSNGNKYVGDILQLYQHGNGTITYYATGDVYEGSFVCDKMTGKGKYTFKNGDRYDGDFVDSKMEGEGVYIWADGSKYVGSFSGGLINGKGVFTFASADGASASRYEGDFVKGMKHGQGTYYFDNGDVYTGTYANDKRTGYGVFRWANGETYTGNFIDNQLDTRLKNEKGEFIINSDGSYAHGDKAVYTWPNGRTYTGYFENGKIVAVQSAAA